MARRLGAKFKKQRRDRATAAKAGTPGPTRFLGRKNKVSEARAKKALKKNAFRSY
jgi:hypothetical protein